MKKDLKVAIIQTRVPSSKNEGEQQVKRLVKEALKKPVDMIGLPEDCVTDNYEEIKSGYDALEFLSSIAKENNVYLFGATAIWEKDGFHKRGFYLTEKEN